MYSFVLKSKFLIFINNEIVYVRSVLIIIAIMSVDNDMSVWLEMLFSHLCDTDID